MVDSLQDCGLIVLDLAGVVMSWNAGATGLLGYKAKEAVGKSFARIVPPEDLDESGLPASLALARQEGRHEELCFRTHSDGSDLALREVVIPLRDRQQNVLGFGIMMQSLDAARHAGAGRQIAIAARKAPRVLLVDDDDVVRTMATHLLEDLGYEVIAAAGGTEALEILARDGSIDVLFTDVVMPGMNGGELAEQAEILRPELKILFTSGYFQHALVKKGNISPHTNLLVKPYCRKDLARKMSKLLADDVSGADNRLLANA